MRIKLAKCETQLAKPECSCVHTFAGFASLPSVSQVRFASLTTYYIYTSHVSHVFRSLTRVHAKAEL
jgi:hypothetical protein